MMYGFTTGRSYRKPRTATRNAGNRTVFPSAEIYHLWANETQQYARNSGDTVSFNGPDAYSYRAVIGRIVRNEAGQRAYLISNRRYSVTTSGHQGALRQSVPEGELIFRLSDLGTFEDHDANLADYQRRMDEAALAYVRARKPRIKGYHLETIQELKDEATAYCEFFGLPAFNAADADAFIAVRLPELEKAEKDRRAKEQEKAKRIRAEEATAAEDWSAGRRSSMPWNYPDTLLRVLDDEVETSRGARVSLDAARKAYRALVAGVDLTGQLIGHFRVTEVNSKHIVIGCHIIDRAEITRLAMAEGWVP